MEQREDKTVPMKALEQPNLTVEEQIILLPIVVDFLKDVQGSHRDEILRNVDSRRNLTVANLTIAGLFLSAGLANIANTGVVCFAYPIVAYYLALEWRRDDEKIADNRVFIREYVERPLAQILN